ncbi:Conserved_hypothetical protein [Hexamita inflata]|uniref:Integrase catalytic domain-containing protein n=1 Tax=Hexamita inflata TaxID=28002 RepID=A0AA86N600_9EUKA|nr:Conserved hypothetical protein [Hexamita inflata]
MQFVNHYDTWFIDLLEFRENKYMKEKVSNSFISIFYNPATHLLHLKQIQNKTPDQIVIHLKELKEYIKSNNLDHDIDQLVSDEGKEYQGQFKEYLVKHKINHRVALYTDSQLAPINSMCRYIRNRLFRMIQDKYQDQNQVENREGQILVDANEVDEIIKDFIKYHNYEHIIPLYKCTPVEIDRKMVFETNNVKTIQNQEFDKLHIFKPGDIVKVLLKKEKLDKQRIRKWSQGTYQVVYKIGSFYQLIPKPFDFDQYSKTFLLKNRYNPFSTPVYFRRGYEMKYSDHESTKYYSYEMENTNFYAFDKILKIDGQDVQIQISRNGRVTKHMIKINQLKSEDQSITTPAELNYLEGFSMPKYYVPVFQMK